MSKLGTTSVFVIRDVKSGKLIKLGPKCGWCTSGAAKSAFALHVGHYYRSWMDDNKGLFDSQQDYILEEIK